jgi:RNA polymerase sigma-70 factor (ECF subfamily)
MEPDDLERIFDAARAIHPEVALGRDVFAAFLHERVGDALPESEIAADLYLACACLAGSAAALAKLDRLYLSLVPQLVARIDGSAAGGDEICQRVRERLLVAREGRPKLAEYRGRGRLASWVRAVAVRVALNLRASDKPVVPEAEADLAGADPELAYLRERYARQFRDAFAGALADLEARERTLLRLQLVDGLGIDGIAALYDTHRATAARWLARARERLFELTRDRLRAAIGVSPTEFESLVRLVRSQLEVSVCRLLTEMDHSA